MNKKKDNLRGESLRVVEEVALASADGELSWQRLREYDRAYSEAPWVKRLDDKVADLNKEPLGSSLFQRVSDEGMLEIGVRRRELDAERGTGFRVEEREHDLRTFDPVNEADEAVAYHEELGQRLVDQGLEEVRAARESMTERERAMERKQTERERAQAEAARAQVEREERKRAAQRLAQGLQTETAQDVLAQQAAAEAVHRAEEERRREAEQQQEGERAQRTIESLRRM